MAFFERRFALYAVLAVLPLGAAPITEAATLQEQQHELAAEGIARGLELVSSKREQFITVYAEYSRDRLALWNRECEADQAMRARRPDAKDPTESTNYLSAILEINSKRLELAQRINRELREILPVEAVARVVSGDRVRFQFPSCPGATTGTR